MTVLPDHARRSCDRRPGCQAYGDKKTNKQTKQKTTYVVKLDTNLNALVCCAQEDSKYYINTLDRMVKDNNIVVIDEHFSLYI